jgi:hypothetical protein
VLVRTEDYDKDGPVVVVKLESDFACFHFECDGAIVRRVMTASGVDTRADNLVLKFVGRQGQKIWRAFIVVPLKNLAAEELFEGFVVLVFGVDGENCGLVCVAQWKIYG